MKSEPGQRQHGTALGTPQAVLAEFPRGPALLSE